MWIGAGATIPAGYYNSLDGKSGQALKDAISNLAKQHTVLNYYSLWNYFPETDCRLDDHRIVWLLLASVAISMSVSVSGFSLTKVSAM